MRRQLRWYRLAVAVVALAVLAGVVVAWRRGEAAHPRLTAAAAAAPAIPLQPIAAGLRQKWHRPEGSASGEPVFGGTAVTYSEHTVTGRSAATGETRWTFTRSDRSICTVSQLVGRTVAIYRHKGNCDEVTALDTQLGTRVWERTLDADGQAITGTPNIIPSPDVFLVSTPHVIYAIQVGTGGCDPATSSCGADYWRYPSENGCSILGVAAGSAGVLIGEHCPGGDRLRLHDRYRGPDEATKYTAIIWTVPTPGGTPLPAMASVPITAVTGNRLITYSPGNGHVVHTATLRTAPKAGVGLQTRAEPAGQLLFDGRYSYLVRPDGTIGWTLACDGLGRSGPEQGLGYIRAGDVVSAIALGTGAVRARYPVPGPARGVPIRLGSGFLLASPTTTAFYR